MNRLSSQPSTQTGEAGPICRSTKLNIGSLYIVYLFIGKFVLTYISMVCNSRVRATAYLTRHSYASESSV